MIHKLSSSDFDDILHVINDAAQAFRGVIPPDLWKEPYMSAEELRREIESGVEFYGWFEAGRLIGVTGLQKVRDKTLIRHSYVMREYQKKGIGGRLLERLKELAETSEILVGTWKAAVWAIRFYEKHGFKLLTEEEGGKLLREYWNIPERQIETSVVLRFQKNIKE